MAGQEEQWVATGARFSARLMLEQAETLLALIEKPGEAEALGRVGFDHARRAELLEATEAIEPALAAQAAAKAAIPMHTQNVAAVEARAKRILRHLRMAALNAFQGVDDAALQAFTPAGPLYSLPRLRAHVVSVQLAVAKHQAALASWGFGSAEAEALREVGKALAEADAAQEAAKKELRPETRAVQAAVGRTHGLLKRLVRAGRVAHEDNPAKAAAYNLNILKREAQPQRAPASQVVATAPAEA